MKIKYFGTAAYEGVPSLFCQCETCKMATRLGGKNMRTRAQALVNDEILMDFNADTVAHYQTYKFDWTKVKSCLITHGHSDHFYPKDLIMFAEPGYASIVPHIDFYAPKFVNDQIKAIFSSERADKSRGTTTEVAPGDLVKVGDNKVLVMKADHDLSVTPVIYAIEDKDGKRVLYAHDTGMFTDDVIADMKRLGRFDIVSLDCTGAAVDGVWKFGHMNLNADVETKALLIKEGLAHDRTKFVVTHFSHNSLNGLDHDALVAKAAEFGFIVAYDGMEIEA